MIEKNPPPEHENEASVAGLVSASAGNAVYTGQMVGGYSRLQDSANDDRILGQVVLAEILAGNHAATDSLTFDVPAHDDNAVDSGGGSFAGGGSSGSFDSGSTYSAPVSSSDDFGSGTDYHDSSSDFSSSSSDFSSSSSSSFGD